MLRSVCHTASRFVKSTTNSTVVHRNRITNAHQKSNTSTSIRCKSATTESSLNSRASSSSNKVTSTTETTTAKTTANTNATAESQSTPLAQTAFAAAAGITTVSIAAVAVESTTASSVPPFDPAGQRFDQSTFLGRFCRMVLACDPRLLTYSSDDTKRAKEMVLNYASLLANLPDGMTELEMNHALWEAQRISSSSLHPDTGDTIPQPFRMSGYVPYNGPICCAMVASTSTPALLFWSWVNQSQNALVNYFNRNASSEMDNATLAKSYSAAVVSALTVAFGLATFIQKRFGPDKAKQMMRWVAFPSAVVASSLNCYIVRSPEISSGIPLLNEDFEDVAPGQTSQIAARNGVNSTTASRALLQAPVYFLPPVLMGSLPILKRAVARNPALSVPLTTYLVLVSFGLGLPATVAIFPQMAEIDIQDVEEEYQGLRGKDGLPYQKLYYNKGL